jgi:two-component system, OmpR family, copper resistance phosphate regulon response regulator CusR
MRGRPARPGQLRQMKILIVEDEPKTAASLRKGLVESGFIVDVVENGADGLYFTTAGDYDLIVLDVVLPQVDGWSILGALRSAGKQTPVLFLTARDAVPDRVKGLELGADDYLVKPFAFSELLARIRSLLRRGPVKQADTLWVADLEIDHSRQSVTRGGRYIDLTRKEFALVSLLARHTGEILSRTLITEQVWDINFDCDSNVVDVAIRRLRSKIDDPFHKKLIHSVRGRGYVLEPR